MNQENLEKYNQLPEILRNYVCSEKVQEKIKKIEDDFVLSYVSQKFREIIDQVFFGSIDSTDVTWKLEQQLDLDFKEALDIGSVLYTQIFDPIRKELKKQQERFKLKNKKSKSEEKIKREKMSEFARESSYTEVSKTEEEMGLLERKALEEISNF